MVSLMPKNKLFFLVYIKLIMSLSMFITKESDWIQLVI